jgi:large subunit ribosomal protein L28
MMAWLALKEVLDGEGGGSVREPLSEDARNAMARRCELTGKAVRSGHLVSHANNKKKRVFRPNLQTVRLASDALGQSVSLKISMNALRTIDRLGGLDGFLLKARSGSLSTRALRIKRQIAKKQAKESAAA